MVVIVTFYFDVCFYSGWGRYGNILLENSSEAS